MEESYMKLAIEGAKKSSERLPCGAVIVKDGEVVAVAHNSIKKEYDCSAHAEIKALRKAGAKLGSNRVEGCTIYCTCEPCIMCLSAISFARIKKIVYGLTLREVSPMDRVIDVDLETFLEKNPRKIEVVKNFMKEECEILVKNPIIT